MGEDVQIHWQFEREGSILLSKSRRMLVEFFLYMSSTMLADGLSFILWPKVDLEAGRQHQVYFILVWPMSNHALPSCGLILQYSDSILCFLRTNHTIIAILTTVITDIFNCVLFI